MATDEEINGVEIELTCLCGYETFERVVVQRKPHKPFVTYFVACVSCKAMYSHRERPIQAPVVPPGHGHGIGGPQPERMIDSASKVKRDAAAQQRVTSSRGAPGAEARPPVDPHPPMQTPPRSPAHLGAARVADLRSA